MNVLYSFFLLKEELLNQEKTKDSVEKIIKQVMFLENDIELKHENGKLTFEKDSYKYTIFYEELNDKIKVIDTKSEKIITNKLQKSLPLSKLN